MKDFKIGWVVAGLTDFMIFYVYFVVYLVLEEKIRMDWVWAMGFGCYSGIAGLAGLSHFVCVVSNPGVFSKEVSERHLDKVCFRCLRVRMKDSHHCSQCGVCVYRMDHHCPWINGCVGHMNQKSYILFLVYTGIFCFFGAVFILWSKVYCAMYIESFCVRQGEYFMDFGKLLALGIVIFFFVFVLYLLSEQYESLSTGKTQIDRLKQVSQSNTKNFKKNFKNLFANQPLLHCFLPFNRSYVLENLLNENPKSFALIK